LLLLEAFDNIRVVRSAGFLDGRMAPAIESIDFGSIAEQ